MEKISKYEVQANDFMTKTGTTMEIKLLGNFPYFEDETEPRDVYQITLKRRDKSYQFRFGQSINNSGKKIQPTAYDILTCLQKYNPGTFDNFCYDFGYDTDSRKAEKTYFDVQKEWANVNRMFRDAMEELQEIQ